MRVFLIIGTRPEAIKMLPLAKELKKYKEFEVKICFSSQHKDLTNSVFCDFETSPDFSFLGTKNGWSLNEMTRELLNYFDVIFREEKPNLVLVHGDTTTAFCASLAAFYLKIKVVHIEAGLRTFDVSSPFPEEFNRVAIDAMSNVHFAPTKTDAENLVKEGINSVFTVGNTVIDALEYSLKTGILSPILDELDGRKLVLVTTHRRENFGDRMRSALLGIRDVVKGRDNVLVIVPVHPNPRVKAVVEEVLGNIKNIKMIEPLPMIEFHNLLSHADVILSDSGGIQEEAAHLGLPLFLLRDKTERTECIGLPNTRLVGCTRGEVARELAAFLDSQILQSEMRIPSNVFGDGNSSVKIAEILLQMTEKAKFEL